MSYIHIYTIYINVYIFIWCRICMYRYIYVYILYKMLLMHIVISQPIHTSCCIVILRVSYQELFLRDRSNARFTSIPRHIDLFMRRVCKAGMLFWITNERWKEEAVVDQLLCFFIKTSSIFGAHINEERCLCNKSVHGEVFDDTSVFNREDNPISIDSTIILNLKVLFCTTDVLTFFLRIFHPSRNAMTRGLVSRCQFFTWASEVLEKKRFPLCVDRF